MKLHARQNTTIILHTKIKIKIGVQSIKSDDKLGI